MTTVYLDPDWVILGATYGDEVLVIASTMLSGAELRHEFDHYDYWIRRDGEILSRFTMKVEFPRYVMVKATSYREAMQKLFDEWEPRKTERMALAQPVPELPGGDGR